MSSSDSSLSKNNYIIDIESAAETARLIDQDHILTHAMGGLFPEEPDLPDVDSLLDIACGPAGWTTEVAFAYPDSEIVGVDINPTMIKYAKARAHTQGLTNISFEAMDIRQPLPFSNHIFDLINARSIAGFMDRHAWPSLLAECRRMLRPGGRIRLVEGEVVVSNSLAMQQLNGALYKSLQSRSFSVDGRSLGLAYMLPSLLQQAGFEQIRKQPFLLDGSFGTPLYASTCKDAEMFFLLIKPHLIASQAIEEAAFDTAYNTMLTDIVQQDFTSLTFGLITWGYKPSHPNQPASD